MASFLSDIRLEAMTREMSPATVMQAFLQFAHAQIGHPELSEEDAVVLHLIETHGWLPAQVRVLSDPEIRLCLHTIWQAFCQNLDQADPDLAKCYRYVLEHRATPTDATWRSTP